MTTYFLAQVTPGPYNRVSFVAHSLRSSELDQSDIKYNCKNSVHTFKNATHILASFTLSPTKHSLRTLFRFHKPVKCVVKNLIP